MLAAALDHQRGRAATRPHHTWPAVGCRSARVARSCCSRRPVPVGGGTLLLHADWPARLQPRSDRIGSPRLAVTGSDGGGPGDGDGGGDGGDEGGDRGW